MRNFSLKLQIIAEWTILVAGALALLLLCSMAASAGTVAGSIQSSGGLGVNNGTLTFTLSQSAVVAGTATLTTQSVSCWTDSSGVIRGLPGDSALAAPSLSTGAGTLGAATYYVRYTWANASGESQPSVERSVILGGAGSVILAAPASVPPLATSLKVYMSSASGTETLQGSVAVTGGVIAGSYTQSSVLVSGAALPSSNTSTCNLRFNDELIPSFTNYSVSLKNVNGATIPGYPQKWYLSGGSAGTINVSSGTPLFSGTVVYPQAIITTPPSNASQSINGPLNMNGFAIVNAAISPLLGTCDAAAYSGSDGGAQINAAESDTACKVIDASRLTSLSAASTVTVTKPVIFGAYTFTTAANPGISVGNNAFIAGKGRNYTVITTTSATADIIRIANGANAWGVYDLLIQSTVLRTAGAGLRISGGNGFAERLLINPVFDGITLDTAGTSGNNTIRDVEIGDGYGAPSAGSGAAWHCGIKVGGVSSGTVASNTIDTALIVMLTAFTDAGLCIQDGTDSLTVSNSQIVANAGGSDSVAIHVETVNGGGAPNAKIVASTVEGGITKNTIVVDAGIGIEFYGVTSQSGLRGLLVNGGDQITWIGGKFHLNNQEGVRIVGGTDVSVIGARFSENSQATTNTYDDIFVAAGVTQFHLNSNTHKDYFSTGKVCKWGIEIAAGGSDIYTVTGDINNGSCTTGRISDGGTGLTKNICNVNGVCANGLSVGFNGDLAASRSNTTAVLWLGGDGSVLLDRGVTTAGTVTLSGAGLNVPGLLSTGLSQFRANRVAVASDFTTANNTNLQTITGLTWSLPAVAANYSFDCHLLWSQGTANAAVAFGIQAATNAPTNIAAMGFEQTNSTAFAAGGIATLTTTTATAILSATPAVIGSNIVTDLHGTIENPAAANAINIMVSTATGADAVTVRRGSFCILY